MNKVALITGTSHGIGKETAKMFLKFGIEVIGLDLYECPEELSNEELYRHYICDISDPSQLPYIQENISWIVNNAGTDKPDKAIQVNLMSLFHIEDKYVDESTQCVVNICSASAHYGIEGREYVASTGGILSYTKQLAKRMAAWGGRCVSISPGPVITDMTNGIADDEEKYKQVADQNLLKRWISPKEIAFAIHFMCVCECVTGIDLLMDCGEHINQTEIV